MRNRYDRVFMVETSLSCMIKESGNGMYWDTYLAAKRKNVYIANG